MIKFLLFLVFKISSLPNNGLSLPGRSTFANPEHLCILDLLLLSAERRLGTLQLPGIFTCLAPGALLSLFFENLGLRLFHPCFLFGLSLESGYCHTSRAQEQASPAQPHCCCIPFLRQPPCDKGNVAQCNEQQLCDARPRQWCRRGNRVQAPRTARARKNLARRVQEKISASTAGRRWRRCVRRPHAR